MPETFEALFSFLCHRDPCRSYLMADNVVLLCARCTGVYFGALSGLMLLGVVRVCRLRRIRLPFAWIYVAGVLATPVEIVMEHLAPDTGSNDLRFASAFITGASLVVLLWLRNPKSHSNLTQRSSRYAQAAVLVGLFLAFFSVLHFMSGLDAAPLSLSILVLLGIASLAGSILRTGVSFLLPGSRGPNRP